MRSVFIFRRSTCLDAFLGFALLAAGTGGGGSPLDEPGAGAACNDVKLIGLTSPHRRAALACLQEGRIQSIPYAEGAFVREGELLIALFDDVQRANVNIAAAKAETTLDVELARARFDQAERERERLLKLHGNANATVKELVDAISVAEVAQIEHELARFNHQVAQRTHAMQRAVLDQFRIEAPFDGYVSEVRRQPGETVDRFDVILTLVQLDPLEVVFDCPVAAAPCLREGDRVPVRPVDNFGEPRVGTVTFVSRVADGGSQTFRAKLVVDNPDQSWLAGMKVEVDLAQRIEPAAEATVANRAGPSDIRATVNAPPDPKDH